MTAWMRARVASCTSGDWLITRDTVFFETLASRAMSLMVALRPGLMPAGFSVPAALTGADVLGCTRGGAAFFRVRVMVSIVRNRVARGQARHLTITAGQRASWVRRGNAGCRCR